MGQDSITRKMLNVIRESEQEQQLGDYSNPFPITKNTPNFGDIRISQEEELLKTIGENVEMGENALVYYPIKNDLVLTAKIASLNLAFQFKFNDESGKGLRIWANAVLLNQDNYRTIGKILDAFEAWKDNLIKNSDILTKLEQVSKK